MAKKRVETQRLSEPEDSVRKKVNFVISNDNDDADELEKQIEQLVVQIKNH